MRLCGYSDQLILAEIESVELASGGWFRVKTELSTSVLLVFVSNFVFFSVS